MAKTTSGNQNSLETLTHRIRVLSAKPNLTGQEKSELGEIERQLRYFGKGKRPTPQQTDVSSEPTEDVPFFDMPPSGGKKKKNPKTRKGKRLNQYQQHIKECRLGKGDYDGQGKRDFNECVGLWRDIKKKRKEL